MRPFIQNQKGAALPVVLGIIVVGTLVGLGLLGFLFNEISKSQTVTESIQAKYAAEAGAETLLSVIEHKPAELIDIQKKSCSAEKVSSKKMNGYDLVLKCSMTEKNITLTSTASGEQSHTTTVTLDVTKTSPLELKVSSWE
ncbi:hypothetical protein [Alkalicoccobacillus gibsonii]|uniref:hypothetical protein n=1 Tax=Alkalicoccobacillus gibsonii TaxID=79881 RepID=UPI0019319177|nr:hypothetical protein [Alkalicoccobacillus gibsonii]MBM0067216.1 hypothetical protein [Alkalicoccobacillus gibsonii]